MKNKQLKIILKILIIFCVLFIATSFGCLRVTVRKPAEEEPAAPPPVEEPVEEPPVEEPPAEEPPAETPAEEEEINEEELKEELLARLNDFFEAVNEDREYEFFSSETREIVGTEEEYRTGARTDYYFIIQEAHSDWRNVEAIDIEVDDGEAFLTISGDRTAEGMEYTDDEVVFKFVYEEGEWKIDFSGN
jgi:hypothetical protein